MLRLALIALLLGTSVAHAAPPGQTPPQYVPEVAPVEQKDPSIAVLLSLGVTTAGFLTLASAEKESTAMLGLAGMYLGPSTGRWYAGNVGLSGLGLRALAGAAMLYGFVNILESECDYESECSDSDDLGGLLLIGGAGLWIGSSIADVIFARNDAVDYNKRHQLSLGPTRMSTPGGGATGLALTGRF